MYRPNVEIKRVRYADVGGIAPHVQPTASASPPPGMPHRHEGGEAPAVHDTPTKRVSVEEGRGEKETPKAEGGEAVKPSAFGPLTDDDEKWIQKRLKHPTSITSSDLVGLQLARHYAEGGEAVGYRHPLAFLSVDGIPERFHENRGLRAALAMCKFPSGLVCVRTDDRGRDYWDATARGLWLFYGLSDLFEDYRAEAWFIRAMSGNVMPRRQAYRGDA